MPDGGLGFDGNELVRGMVSNFVFLLVAFDKLKLELVAEGVGEVFEADLDVFRWGVDAHYDVEEGRFDELARDGRGVGARGCVPPVVGVVENLAGLNFDVDFILSFVVVEGVVSGEERELLRGILFHQVEPGAVGPLVEGV
eukprot:scaffold1206_cov124-Isochrysis_galbana.AAC.5